MSSIDKLIKDNEDKILQFEEEFKNTNSEEKKILKRKNENNLSQEKENKKK